MVLLGSIYAGKISFVVTQPSVVLRGCVIFHENFAVNIMHGILNYTSRSMINQGIIWFRSLNWSNYIINEVITQRTYLLFEGESLDCQLFMLSNLDDLISKRIWNTKMGSKKEFLSLTFPLWTSMLKDPYFKGTIYNYYLFYPTNYPSLDRGKHLVFCVLVKMK